MVVHVIHRTRKDRCQKARALLLFVTQPCCRLRHISWCILGVHAPRTTNSKQSVNYFTQTYRVTRIYRETAIQGHSRSRIWRSLKSRRGAVYPVYTYPAYRPTV